MNPTYRRAIVRTTRVESLSDKDLHTLLTSGYNLLSQMFVMEQRAFIKLLILLEIEQTERLTKSV